MSTPKVLTRRELYDLVWSKPTSELAADFGISDVGLAKICDRHRIPKPGRGYWAKVQAGKKTLKKVFREIHDPALNRIEIRSWSHQLPAAAREVIERAKAERIEPKTVSREQSAPSSTEPHPNVHSAIKRTAKALRKARPDANSAVQAIGDGLCGVDVAVANIERVIAFLDTLTRKLETKGLPLEPTGKAMRVALATESATFTIKEGTRREKHVPTSGELAAEERRRKKRQRYWQSPHSWDQGHFDLSGRAYPEFNVVYTGALVLQVEGFSDGVRRRWADGKTQTVESLLDSIVVGLETLLLVRRARREEREDQERQWRERTRRMELARRRAAREEKRASYLNRIVDLYDEMTGLRQWLADIETLSERYENSDFGRMVAWAKKRLAKLESMGTAEQIDRDLKGEKLFPDLDELHDPEGDPPDEPYSW